MADVSHKLSNILSIVTNISSDLLVHSSSSNLYIPINYHLLNHGKKTRGVLAFLSHNLFSDNIMDVKELALAIESLHEFTLIHDDIMDNATVRRGQATINKKWSISQALLSGDVLLINSYKFLLKSKKFNSQLIDSFNDTAQQICEGQQLDMDMQFEDYVTMDQYLKMIDLKTGALIRFSLTSPSLCLNRIKSELDLLDSIGTQLGRLFQIKDDYLDIYGESELTGKTIGIDIKENKKTFFYIHALELMPKNKQKMFVELYNSNNSDKVSKILYIYNNLRMQEVADKELNAIYKKTLNLIDQIQTSNLRKELLLKFISNLFCRLK